VKLLLKDFQTRAVDRLVMQLRLARREAAARQPQAVCLASPTGSGKTVVATAAIERILEGDGQNGPDPGAMFVWITDQPELNEQTRRKMLAASSTLLPTQLTVIGPSFDQERFTPGQVYFLNTQKLGKEKYLVSAGDDRNFTIWETFSNTVAESPDRLYLFIDEAHRGMGEDRAARELATTIIQKFIKGLNGEVPPVPLVVGISATPERFQRLVEGVTRTLRPVTIPPEEVRVSGLLKEVMTLYHPTEAQPSDITMLRAAANTWASYTSHWAEYCQVQVEGTVQPIMVVQVKDGTGRQLSRTDIPEAIRAIKEEVGPLPERAFVHAFQEGYQIKVGDHELRYVSPADIDNDPDARVVFFKTSLNTGWDCPRAETMMSFRTAADATLIAQLVGRMVRTPLARRIDSDEYLNTVALYLPHYDASGLSKVIERLTAPDPEILPPVKIRPGNDVAILGRASRSGECFDALTDLPSYVIPRSAKTTEVKRLMKLARLLANDGIVPDGPDQGIELLVGVLRSEHERLKETDAFRTIVEARGTLDVRAVTWRYGLELGEEEETVRLDISKENISDLFDWAGRNLDEGLHKAYWKAKAIEDREAKIQAKLEIVALSLEPTVVRNLEATAQTKVGQWLDVHDAAIRALPEGPQQAYDEIRRLATEPEKVSLTYPDIIEVPVAQRKWDQHIYADSQGKYPVKLNTWETKVVEAELARGDVLGWLRNPDQRPWSLCIPYEIAGEYRALYPDFLVLRREAGRVRVDLLDPHSTNLADAPAKAAGLARYAAKHARHFGRIELIVLDGARIKRLDLKNEDIRDRVKAVHTHEHLEQLFESA
jgi:type III restriction enzyme